MRPLEVVGQWIDRALRDHGLDLLEVESCLARLAGPGRRDIRAIQEAMARRPTGYDPGESNLEARVIRVLAAAGLPPPSLQHPVLRGDGRHARIDVAFPWALVAIEPEGFEFHHDRSAFDTAAAALDLATKKLGLPDWRMPSAESGHKTAPQSTY